MDVKRTGKRKASNTLSPRRSPRLSIAESNEQAHSVTSSIASASDGPPWIDLGCLSLSLAVRGASTTKRRRASIHHRKVQGVPQVAHALVNRFSFFSFPAELRNMIYDYSLHYPDSRQLYCPYYRRQLSAAAPDHHQNQPHTPWAPRLHTPTILLLSKRITSECLPMLKSRTLVIDRLPPPRPLGAKERTIIRSYSGTRRADDFDGFMQLSNFISPRTLQCIPHIELNVGLCEGLLGSGWAWEPIVTELLDILKQRNVCAKLRLLIRLCNTHEDSIVWHSDKPYQALFEKKFENFALDNPNVFAQREIKVEIWNIVAHKASYVSSKTCQPKPSLSELQRDAGEVVKFEKPRPQPRPTPRWYPDKEMFPGSVMQFAKPVSSLYYGDDDYSD